MPGDDGISSAAPVTALLHEAQADPFPLQSANSALHLAHFTSFLPPPVSLSSGLKFSHPLLAAAMQRDKLAVLDLLFRASIK